MTRPVRPDTIFHLDPRKWIRVGRGRGLDFFAMDDDVEQLLRTLPPEFGPYQLIGSDPIKQDGIYVEVPFTCSVSELAACRMGPTRKRWSFWIHSLSLYPDLTFTPGDKIDAACSLSGLIGLQHGSETQDGARRESRITLVDRVRNIDTGELVVHDASLKLYRKLVRAIEPKLVYSVLLTFRDGTVLEESRLQRMTEAAAEAARAGYRFTVQPGRRIDPSVRSQRV